MCLVTRRSFKRPYNNSTVRWKWCKVSRRGVLRAPYYHIKYVVGKWLVSDRGHDAFIPYRAHLEVLHGFHVYVHPKIPRNESNFTLLRPSATRALLKVRVRGFVASGSNARCNIGPKFHHQEVWHEMKVIKVIYPKKK